MPIISFSTDVVVNVYKEYSRLNMHSLFTDLTGWSWDQARWPSVEGKNLSIIPSYWDPFVSQIDSNLFQSGIGNANDLDVRKLAVRIKDGIKRWTPLVNHGYYFINKDREYLYSSQAIHPKLTTLLNSDGNSILYLHFIPKPGVPILAGIFTRDDEKNIVIKEHFRQVTRFTGKISNGVELNTDEDITNTNKVFKEFKVITNSSNVVKNERLPSSGEGSSGEIIGPELITFSLSKPPLSNYSVRFSRKDIFVTEVTDIPNTAGEYMIVYKDQTVSGFNEGDVLVYIGQNVSDLGYATFVWDYPATLVFNNNYVKEIGVNVSTFTDVAYLDIVGRSSGQGGQRFYTTFFPVFENTFELFVFDRATETFTEWTAVDSFYASGPNDTHYILDPDTGEITFGDGINGMIPPILHEIGLHYFYAPYIKYEPDYSTDIFEGRRLDLNPLNLMVNQGFVYLSRKSLIPSKIVLTTDSPLISGFTDLYGPLDALTGLSRLTATVLTENNEAVPNVSVRIIPDTDAGTLSQPTGVTDFRGKFTTSFIPFGSGDELFEHGYFYQIGQGITPIDALSVVTTTNITDDTLIIDGDITVDPEVIYVFKVLDNDPLNGYDPATRLGGRAVVLRHSGDAFTKLTQNIDEDDTEIFVTDTFDFPTSGTITIGSETITYASVGSFSFKGCTRGISSTAAIHLKDAQVIGPTGVNILTRPIDILNNRQLVFDRKLDTPTDDPDLVQYIVVSPKIVGFQAKLISNIFAGLRPSSNIIRLQIDIPLTHVGPYTLPVVADQIFDGSTISTGTYFDINP